MPNPPATGFRVVVRVRPGSGGTGGPPSCVSVEGPTSSSAVLHVTNPNDHQRTPFGFPCVLSGPRDTEVLRQDVLAPLVQSVLDGYHATLFAYGATGSGKTFSMNSCRQHVIASLFQAQAAGAVHGVHISFVELYNEEFRDLLVAPAAATVTTAGPAEDTAAASGGPALTLRHDPKEGPLLEALTRVAVRTAKEAHALLNKGQQQRHTAATDVHDRSSRSHALVTFYVHTATPAATAGSGAVVTKLHLVDLAGSEKQQHSKDACRQREAIHINTSLTALGQVILALAKREAFVPYRRSMLTRFLQGALGGHAFAVMMAHVRTEAAFVESTLTTLRYATQALRIDNKPHKSTSRALVDNDHDHDNDDRDARPRASTPVPWSRFRARRQSLHTATADASTPTASAATSTTTALTEQRYAALAELRHALADQRATWQAMSAVLAPAAKGPADQQQQQHISPQQQLWATWQLKQQHFYRNVDALLESLEATLERPPKRLL